MNFTSLSMQKGNACLNLDAVQEEYLYQIVLLGQDQEATADFKTYFHSIGNLKSEIIKTSRLHGWPYQVRIGINVRLSNSYSVTHKAYLYAKSKLCGICHQMIFCIEDATIDHIIPTSKGGPNILSNKQLAHGLCNVRKSNKMPDEI